MKKSKRRIAAFISAVSLASGAAMVATPALAAGDELISGGIVGTPAAISCGGFAGSYYTVTNISKVKKVTHASKYYNGTSSNAKATYSSEKQLTLTAGLTYSVGASTGATVDFKAVAAKLEANTRLDLAASGSKTSGSTLSISATIKPKKYLVVAAGNTQVTGKWKKNYCASGNSGVVVKASGTGKSHTIRETAAVQCDLSQPSGSLAGLAKSRYC
ncbi:hypothetical protein QMQ05_03445 [Glutamicibacter ectropisis]|uniref:Tat pathway signal sequence domain protein n=1 Tax=Glutamicibacter ectropisis TaxID=3046593 RepID=A0AAU6WF44_9MICC